VSERLIPVRLNQELPTRRLHGLYKQGMNVGEVKRASLKSLPFVFIPISMRREVLPSEELP
jgi:hypothetical protein